jgi:NAD(P)-dependent dehydrogenase (short-subunit alcohol dehydrogenase family)
MTDKKVWLITGAGRGLGLHIARAALAAGHAVVATGRDPSKVKAAIGHHTDLLTIKLDITRLEDAQAAVASAVAQLGRVDVLVNNAGNFYASFFEQLSPEQVRNQIETLLFGPMNVTRAVLPVMRKQRAGLLIAISSTAGLSGQLFCTAYAAAKFGVEGWMESLAPEIAPFGIRRCWLSPASSALNCAVTTLRRTPSPPSTTTPSKPGKSSQPGAAWTASREATPQSLPTQSCILPGSKSLRFDLLLAPMPCRPSRPRPTACSLRRTHIVLCPPPSLTRAHAHGAQAAYRWIGGNVYRKSTDDATTAMYLREIRGGQRFSADYHQQYLAKNPNGYCGIGGCGVPFKIAELQVGEKG